MVGAYASPRSARLRNHLMGGDLSYADHVGEPMRIHARSDAPLARVHKPESVIVDRSAQVPAAFVAGMLDTCPKPCSGKPKLDLLVLSMFGGAARPVKIINPSPSGLHPHAHTDSQAALSVETR
jgi:hypothetical protein